MSSQATYTSRIPALLARVDAGVEAAVERSAQRVKAGAMARVPVGAPMLHLRNTIRVRGEGHSREVVAGSRKAFYGHFVEWGTVKVRARPFMTPAAELEAASKRLERDVKDLFS